MLTTALTRGTQHGCYLLSSNEKRSINMGQLLEKEGRTGRAHLDAVHQGGVGGLPALAQVIGYLFPLGEHLVLPERTQPLEQWMASKLHMPSHNINSPAHTGGRTALQTLPCGVCWRFSSLWCTQLYGTRPSPENQSSTTSGALCLATCCC